MNCPPSDRDAPDALSTKLLVVDVRSAEGVEDHPALSAWLTDGWAVKSARPRVTATGAKLLVVLTRPASHRSAATERYVPREPIRRGPVLGLAAPVLIRTN